MSAGVIYRWKARTENWRLSNRTNTLSRAVRFVRVARPRQTGEKVVVGSRAGRRGGVAPVAGFKRVSGSGPSSQARQKKIVSG